MTKRITLKQARQTLGITRRELAEASGVVYSTVSRIENGVSDFAVRFETATMLAQALACRVDEIEWPNGLSARGRMPASSSTYIRTTIIVVENLCGDCHTLLPVSGQCDNCT